MYPEEEQKGVAIAHSLALEAWQVNGLTAHAPLVQQFDLLNGMGNIQVVNGRITFPGKIDRLSFDPNKLLMGVLGGTFENKDEETVVISYPHERQG
ncbi:hypothetical protein A3H19_01485 [Candidatus Woesebacteria bacterium RIFCSPLOWO2_12_FULL_39_9]|nr:MAG: hypothetical protein A3H19_01485 [Candidatus Woesebacteria bacterium RIFCSPLOWO2_12_FULL_39_9]